MYGLFDIGGTKTRLAVSSDGVTISEPVIIDTPKDFEPGITAVVDTLTNLAQGKSIEVVVGGIAGPVDVDQGVLLNAPNLPNWIGKSLVHELSDRLSTQAYVRNDTAMAGLGEATKGAGQESEILAYVTVSTGVGGARIVREQIDESVFGFEPGHQIIDWQVASSDTSGHLSHLDGLISGRAVSERFGCPPYEITDDKIWQDLSFKLAVGLYNTVLHWSPDTIVLGGSMMKDPGIKIAAVEDSLTRLLKIFPKIPAVKKAELGDVGGLYGAMAFARKLKS